MTLSYLNKSRICKGHANHLKLELKKNSMLLPNYIHTNKNSTLQRITLGHSHYDPSRLHNTIYFILTPCHMANKLACSYQLAHATSAYGGSLLGSAWQNN